MFGWLKTSQSNAFATSLAQELLDSLPKSSARPVRPDKADRAVSRAIERIHTRAREYVKANRVGYFQRSRMGNRFLWTLRDAGVDRRIAEDLTIGLLREMARRG